MAKKFNAAGACFPEMHYMVPLDQRLAAIKKMVDSGDYFTMNRGRQYGKTTTLHALASYLKDAYLVVSMDFQMEMSQAKFQDEESFAKAFARAFYRILCSSEEGRQLARGSGALLAEAGQAAGFGQVELFEILRSVCGESRKPVVLLIDEVDSASNNQVFLDFLAQLRGAYLKRTELSTFHSVILAGVYDIRNLKSKFRPEEAHKVNSPWNIAVSFDVPMSFSIADIKAMLEEYEQDYRTGMDLEGIARRLFDYTSGYPFLVSRICKILDEKLPGTELFPDREAAWTKEGILEAVKQLLMEKNPLFESLNGKLTEYPEIRKLAAQMLFQGRSIAYNPDNEAMDIAMMFGFIRRSGGSIEIANRIFETRLYNRFLAEEDLEQSPLCNASLLEKNQFIYKGHLNMRRILEKFTEHFSDLYAGADVKFLEEEGRRLFLLYLRPIINGTGNYYIEARTRNMGRTDVIVDYAGEQFVIELKIWRGAEYHQRGEEQLMDYLDSYRLDKGYMVSFNFNKKKEIGVFERNVGGRILYEAVV